MAHMLAITAPYAVKNAVGNRTAAHLDVDHADAKPFANGRDLQPSARQPFCLFSRMIINAHQRGPASP
jgi:hypothetical protein